MPTVANGLVFTFGTFAYASTNTSTLCFNYTAICTNFTHTSGSVSFTGNARLQGLAFQTSGTSTDLLGTAPDLTLLASSAIYTTIGTTTFVNFRMPFSDVTNPYQTYTPANTTFDGSLAASFLNFDGTTMSGPAFGEYSVGGVSQNGGNIELSLTAGGTCPV